MSKDTIYRQDAMNAFDCSIGGVPVESVKYVSEYADKMMSRISALPSAQPERPKGKWVKKMLVTETEKYISYDPEWYCNCCGTKYDSHIAKIVNFCYICGADMREGQDA